MHHGKHDSDIRLIATDFDGTIFAEFAQPPIPHALQELLAQLQKQGVKWVINTGRDLSSLLEALGRAHVTVHPDFLVLVEREIFRREHARYIGLTDWNARCQREHEELFARLRPHLAKLVDWVASRYPNTTLYSDTYSPFCMIAGNHGDADAIQAHVETLRRQFPQLAFVRNDVYARFSHADFNKGTALTEIARRLGLDAEAVFVAGDHLNDLPMLDLSRARWLGAPANAVAPVKAAVLAQGGKVSAAPHGEGTLEILQGFLQTTRTRSDCAVGRENGKS